MALSLCQNGLLRNLFKIFTDHTMILQGIFVSLSMKILEKINLGQLKREVLEVLILQYTRNTVNNSEVDLTLLLMVAPNLVKLTEVKLSDFI